MKRFEKLLSPSLVLLVAFNYSGIVRAEPAHTIPPEVKPPASENRPAAPTDLTEEYKKSFEKFKSDDFKTFTRSYIKPDGEKFTTKSIDRTQAMVEAFEALLKTTKPVREKLQSCSPELTKLLDQFRPFTFHKGRLAGADEMEFAAFFKEFESYLDKSDLEEGSVKGFLASAKELYSKIFERSFDDAKVQADYKERIDTKADKEEAAVKDLIAGFKSLKDKGAAKACFKKEEKKEEKKSDKKDEEKKPVEKSDKEEPKSDEGKKWDAEAPTGNGPTKPEEKPEPPKPVPPPQPPKPEVPLELPRLDSDRKPPLDLKGIEDLIKALLAAQKPDEKKDDKLPVTPPKLPQKEDNQQAAVPPPQATPPAKDNEKPKEERADKQPPSQGNDQQQRPQQPPPMPQSGQGAQQVISGDSNNSSAPKMPENAVVREESPEAKWRAWYNDMLNTLRSGVNNGQQAVSNWWNNGFNSGVRTVRGASRTKPPVSTGLSVGAEVSNRMNKPRGTPPASIRSSSSAQNL